MFTTSFHSFLALVLLIIATVHAHIDNNWPPPYRSKYNPLVAEANRDYGTSGPISDMGPAGFPCKGELLADHPPAATLTTGKEHNITFLKGAPHDGGSCQVSLSYDEKSYYVIHSWIGGCPAENSAYKFTIPSDAPIGKASFVWTWLNKSGAREFYGTCSSVMIEAGSGGPTPAIPFHDRPDVFVAHLKNCPDIPHGTDVSYEYPGPDADVTVATDVGEIIRGCKPINGIGNIVRTGGSGSQTVSAPAPPSSSGSIFTTASSKLASSSTLRTTTVRNPTVSACRFSTLPVSTHSLVNSKDMRCGPSHSTKCPIGLCCSVKGWCGNSPDYCAAGVCMEWFGLCDSVPGSPPGVANVVTAVLTGRKGW